MNTFARVINEKLVDSRPVGGNLQVALGRTPSREAAEDDEHRVLFFSVHSTTDWPALKATLLSWLTARLAAAGVDTELGYCTTGCPQKAEAATAIQLHPARCNVPTFCSRLNPLLVEITASGTGDKNLVLGFPGDPPANAVRVVLATNQSAEEARLNLLAWVVDHLQACGVQADLIL